MKHRNKIITVFGGSGFIGSYVVRELAKSGAKIKVVGKHATSASHLRTMGSVGQIALINANLHDKNVVNELVQGSSFVVNLVGILFEKGNSSFENLHVTLASNIAEACKKNNIERLVHISALGVDNAKTSKYAKSKLSGEKEVHKHFPKAVILRPSVVFGPEDSFINLFNWISKFSPMLPLIGGGHTLMQPVYVGDIAKAVLQSLDLPEKTVCGKILELGGATQYTFKEIIEIILYVSKRNRLLVPLPFWFAKLKAFFFEFMPRPLLTRDQVELLKYNNIVSKDNGLLQLKINPTPMETVITEYVN